MTSRDLAAAVSVLLLGIAGLAHAQAPTTAGGATTATYARVPADQAAELKVGNRPILTFRSQFLSRPPADRVEAASKRIAAQPVAAAATVSQRSVLDLVVITIDGHDMFAITPGDADDLAGETQVQVALTASQQLQLALHERAELRQPARLARAALTLLGFTAILTVVLWVVTRLHRALGARMARMAEQQLERTHLTTRVAVDSRRLVFWVERTIRALATALGALAVYLWLISGLVLFPYTRPWGEALGGFLARTFQRIGADILAAIPGLFYVAVIVLLTRFAIRLMQATLDGVAEGRLHLPGIHPGDGGAKQASHRRPPVALCHRRLVPLPSRLPHGCIQGRERVRRPCAVDWFRAGLVTHMMSGFLLTFTRAIKPGDYIKAGDTEGMVTNVGLLSTKLRTHKGEEVILPNAVAIGGTAIRELLALCQHRTGLLFIRQ